MFKTFSFFFALWTMSIKATLQLRKAFVIDIFMMLASNLIFFSMWGLFFGKFEDVGGWHLNEFSILMAVGSGAYGLMQVTSGGLKYLARMIIEGDLDVFLTHPKNVLFHLAGSKSIAKGWGQLLTTSVLIALAWPVSLSHLFLILFSIVSGCLVFTSAQIIAHSLVFWLGPIEAITQKYCDALFLFALYPTHIYSGWIKVIMFTMIPAGIIGLLPVNLILHFSWNQLAIISGASSLFFAIAIGFFHFSLKKYCSGNQFGVR